VRLAGQGAPLHCMMVSAFQVRHPVPSLARRSHPCRRGHDGRQRQAWSVKASARRLPSSSAGMKWMGHRDVRRRAVGRAVDGHTAHGSLAPGSAGVTGQQRASERAETVGRLESFMGRQDGNSTSPQERLQNIGLIYFQKILPPPTTLNV
jgi:hypothetical protein